MKTMEARLERYPLRVAFVVAPCIGCIGNIRQNCRSEQIPLTEYGCVHTQEVGGGVFLVYCNMFHTIVHSEYRDHIRCIDEANCYCQVVAGRCSEDRQHTAPVFGSYQRSTRRTWMDLSRLKRGWRDSR